MESPPVDLHTEELLQPHVAKMHLPTKVVQERKLARLVGGLEHHNPQTEGLGEPIGEGGVEVAIGVKQTYAASALPRFHDQLARAGIEPPLPLFDQLVHHVGS